jgi:hypothetical protein
MNTLDAINSEDTIPYILKMYGNSIGNIGFSTNVAGTTFVDGCNEFLCYIRKNVPQKALRIILEREPDNEYDANAVKVKMGLSGLDNTKSKRIGYIPKDRAELISYCLLNSDKYYVATGNVRLEGGSSLKPNIGVFFDYRITVR